MVFVPQTALLGITLYIGVRVVFVPGWVSWWCYGRFEPSLG
jgi:hypothetical protein